MQPWQMWVWMAVGTSVRTNSPVVCASGRLLPCDGIPVDIDVAGLWLQQTIGHAENGALAAAADADDAVKGPRFHGKGEPVDDVKILAGILVGNIVETQNTHVRISQAISQKPSS